MRAGRSRWLRPAKVDLPRTPSFRLDCSRAFAASADAGVEVTFAARGRDDVEVGAAAIHANGGTAETVVLDVSEIAAVASIFADAVCRSLIK